MSNIKDIPKDTCVYLIYADAYYYRKNRALKEESMLNKQDIIDDYDKIKDLADDIPEDEYEDILHDTVKSYLGDLSSDFVFNHEIDFVKHIVDAYNIGLLGFQKNRSNLLFSTPSLSSYSSKNQTITVKMMYYGEIENAEEDFWSLGAEIVKRTYDEEWGHFEIHFTNKILTIKETADEIFSASRRLILRDTMNLYGINSDNYNFYKKQHDKEDEDDDNDNDGMKIL